MSAVSNSAAQLNIWKLQHARFKTHMVPTSAIFSLYSDYNYIIFYETNSQLQPVQTLPPIQKLQ